MLKKLSFLVLFCVVTFFSSKTGYSAIISGTIGDNSSAAISNVTVLLVFLDKSSTTATTDVNGFYSFNVPFLSICGTLPLKPGYTFTPSTYTYAPLDSINKTGQDFTGTLNLSTFSVSGYVKDNSVAQLPVIGAVVALASQSTTYIAITDSQGFFEFQNLLQDIYVLSPIKSSWTFNPSNISYTPLSANQTNQNFVGTGYYSVSGYAKDSSSSPVGGVSMRLQSVTTTYTKLTDISGYFEFLQVPSAVYTLTPTKNNWAFGPLTKTYNPLNSDSSQQNFTGLALVSTYSISGFTRDDQGIPVSSVTVALSGNDSMIDLTDASGAYEFINLSSGNYAVTPTKTNWNFIPSNITYSALNVNYSSQNFTGTPIIPYYSVSGYVLTATSTPLEGITVAISNGSSTTSAKTNSIGYFQLQNILAGTYTVTPSSPGYTFNPLFKNYSPLDSNKIDQNFTATVSPVAYFIKGYIFEMLSSTAGASLSGTKVTLSGDNQAEYTTTVSGYYEFLNIASGNYTVTPSKQGYSFTPQRIQYAPLNADKTDQNFTGSTGQQATDNEPVIDTVQPARLHFGTNQAIRKKMNELKNKIDINKKEE